MNKELGRKREEVVVAQLQAVIPSSFAWRDSEKSECPQREQSLFWQRFELGISTANFLGLILMLFYHLH